ncbi:MAG: type IV secretory system conjugative DNA transfer family protein [Acetobacteraceae bacterium]
MRAIAQAAASTALKVILGCAAATSAWLLGASWMWHTGTGTPFSPLAWWHATQWFGANWWATLWIVLAPVVPTIAVALALFLLYQYRRLRRSSRPMLLAPRQSADRPLERAVTDNYGHSSWQSPEDAAKTLFPGPHPQWGGIVVGEARGPDPELRGVPFDPRNRSTWGPKVGKAKLLIDPLTRGSGHSCIFAGSGAFKSSSAACTILTFTGASVVMDPSTEMGPMLDKALRDQGKEVFHIGVPSEEQPEATGFNVLDFIDITHPEAELHVQSVADWIYDTNVTTGSHKGEDPFFAPMGRQLLLCLLAHLVWADPQTVEISLATLADALARPQQEMLDNLRGIATTSKSPLARRIAKTLADNTAPETFAGVALNCAKGTSWLFTEAYADMVSRGRFNPKMLLDGKITVFLNISLRTLETTPAIARVLVGSLLNALYMAEGKTSGKVLFLIDEAARLGHLRALVTARDTGRKYAIALHLLWQSLGQMTEIWGRDGTRAWIDACDWIGFASVRAGGAGKELSEQLGGYGVLARSEADNQGRQMPFGVSFGTASKGTNISVHEARRALMTASELQQDVRGDMTIIVPASGMPVQCGRALWFARSKMAAVIGRNRFAPSKEREPENA